MADYAAHRGPGGAPGLILNVAVLGVGMHIGAWRYRGDDAATFADIEFYQELGRQAERGKLHAVFLADTLACAEENFERPNLGALDPTVALTAIAAVTKHVGLVATASTTYNEPYNLARRIASRDQLSRGRASWNIVTTFVPDVAANFGGARLPPPTERYERAEEFVEIVIKLWESWEPGALVGDKASGLFADASRVHRLDHEGKHYSVRGPLTLPRTRQGRPLLYQAGSSEQGRDLAGRFADAVFVAQNRKDEATAFRNDIRARAAKFGRDPDHVKITPGFLPILGGTVAEARRRKEELDSLGGDAELRKLALRVGVPVSALDLDKPLPFDLIDANPDFRGSQGFRAAAIALAKDENLTVREILYQNGGGHPQVVGTPEQVADFIEDWYRDSAVDGFNLMIDVLPDGLRDFVDQVVPILQSRGVFHHDYVGETYREEMNIPVPV